MKTETLTIRVSPEEKAMITNLAWSRHMSVAKLLVSLARDADYNTKDAANDLAILKDQIDDLRREVEALAPPRRQEKESDQPEYRPGDAPNCITCRWQLNWNCVLPDYKGKVAVVKGRCPHWDGDK